MTRSLDSLASALQARVFWGVFLGALGRLALWGFLVCGTLALLLRYVLRLERADAAWALAPMALVPLAAWIVARRRRLSHAGAVTWLDLRTDANGALLTELELADARWTSRTDAALARSLALPRPRLGRPALQTFPALAFAAAALWIELPRDPVLPPRKLEDALVERVEEKLETLKEEVALEPELEKELEARLERLEDERGDPEQAFEAIDGLDERLEQEGERLAETIQDAQDSLSQASESAASDPESAQKELEQALGELAKAGLEKNLSEELKSQLGSDSLELPPGTKLDARKIEALSKELSEALATKLDKLGKAGLAKMGKLGKKGELAKLDDFEPTGHVCDENCKKNPGGT
ncbi:MAG: hypothetical protein IPJ77_00330 [Planctomycetes bacterium]|nr:hypothetical protein [Planctomycetota bacterium]